MSVEVVSGRRRVYIVGCYIAPDDAQTIERVVKAMKDKPAGSALIVAGNLNTDLGEVEGDRRGDGDLGGDDRGGTRRYGGALLAAATAVGEGTTDMGNEAGG